MKDIEEVEKVQSRATKQVKSLRGLSHEQRLKSWIYQHWNIDVIVETWLKFIKFYTEFTTQISRKTFYSWYKTIEQEVIHWN